MMMDWLKVYNEADVIPFMEASIKLASNIIQMKLICSKMPLAFQAY